MQTLAYEGGSGSVVVPVPVVSGVPVPVVHVVGVLGVGHRDVTALRSVLVGMALVGQVPGFGAFVHVVIVEAVNVAAVRVIGVIAVLERDVTAALAVGVLVIGVRCVLDGVWHGGGSSLASWSVSYKYISI